MWTAQDRTLVRKGPLIGVQVDHPRLSDLSNLFMKHVNHDQTLKQLSMQLSLGMPPSYNFYIVQFLSNL